MTVAYYYQLVVQGTAPRYTSHTSAQHHS